MSILLILFMILLAVASLIGAMSFVGAGFSNLFAWRKRRKKVRDSAEIALDHASLEDDDCVEIVFCLLEAARIGLWHQRIIRVPALGDVKNNYQPKTFQQLQRLTQTHIDQRRGRLILFRGETGTGKTYAIRALLHAWREYVVPCYVVDTECFLSSEADYMMNTLVAGPGSFDEVRPDQWVLFIMENIGQPISSQSTQYRDEALSRFLNMADGFLTQGMNALFLLTTNEPAAGIHKSVRRPGRCLADIEFNPFTAHEANRWLEHHGSSQRVQRETTLNTLYAMTQGEGIIHEV